MRDLQTYVNDSNEPLDAGDFNSVNAELENAVTSTDQTLDPQGGADTDLNMLGKAMAAYGSAGDYYQDSGSANTYVLSRSSNLKPLTSYFDGMRVTFYPGNNNTGASTVNVSSLGSKDLKMIDGSALPANTLKTTAVAVAIYDSSVGYFKFSSFGSLNLTGLTDNTIIRADGTNGLQDSSIVVSDVDAITGVTSLTVDNIIIDGNVISTTSSNAVLTSSTGFVGINVTPAADNALHVKSLATGDQFYHQGNAYASLVGYENNDNGHNAYRLTTDGAQWLELSTNNSSSTGIHIDTSGNVNVNGDIYIPNDTDRIYLGTGNDLQLFHDGTNSFVSNTSTGDLTVRNLASGAGSDVNITTANGDINLNPTSGNVSVLTGTGRYVIIKDSTSRPTINLTNGGTNAVMDVISNDRFHIGTYSAHEVSIGANSGVAMTIDTSNNITASTSFAATERLIIPTDQPSSLVDGCIWIA